MRRSGDSEVYWSIDDAFPYKVCINLDRRPERWRRMEVKFEEHGLRGVERFSAVDGELLSLPPLWTHTPGAYGCLRSHLDVVRNARDKGSPSVLIFEDDVVLDPDLQNKFQLYFEQVPRDWDMLFFGALHKDEPNAVAENVVRLTKANSTYAYALRQTVYDSFIELNGRAEDVLDNNNYLLQGRFNCYCFMPHLAWVETDYSDAQRRLEHHWYLKESLVLFGAEMDRLLSRATLVLAHRAGEGRAMENLLFVAQYYHDFFSPFLEIVVVEHGKRQMVNPGTLPESCAYLFLRDETPFDRARCFEAGLNIADPKRSLAILSDSDIYLETLDIRANLRMCERYDFVDGFSELISLSKEETSQLRATRTTRGLALSLAAPPLSEFQRAYSRFLNRNAIRLPFGENKIDEELKVRVFKSPGRALRLAID
jgi:GR25 family glycosyltransferase involved in LPS biosynthesis